MNIETYQANLKKLSAEIGLLYNNYNNLSAADKKKAAVALGMFHTIEKTLTSVSFAENDELLKQSQLNVYSELLNNALSVIHQGQFSFKHFVKVPAQQNTAPYTYPEWLMYCLHHSIMVEKALVVSTLLLAGAPTLIVTILPSLFAIAMQLITPLMILLPPLALSIAVLGGLILGLKITEHVLAKQAAANKTSSAVEILKNDQTHSSKNLFEIKSITGSLTPKGQTTFFAGISKDKAPAFGNSTEHFNQAFNL